MSIAQSVTELIGKTPLLNLNRYAAKHNLKAEIVAKLELFNPAGSVKDRIAKSLLLAALKDGTIKEGSVIIEPTSGNTGIGLAALGAALGLRVILVMPETMSVERRKLQKIYGAELVLTPGSEGMAGTLKKSKELNEQIPGSWIPSQFTNPYNPKAHYETTGPEIWQDTAGKLDIFVATFGTGGTVSGAGQYLKEKNPKIKVFAGEPASSPLLTEGHAGPHKIQGIGANFIPENLDKSVVDEFITIPNEAAFETARELALTEGVLTGISSGAALWAATEIAKRPESAGKRIVVILPDTGERYISTALFPED